LIFKIDSLRLAYASQAPKGHPSQLQIVQHFGYKQFTGLFALRVVPSSDGGLKGINTYKKFKPHGFPWGFCFYYIDDGYV